MKKAGKLRRNPANARRLAAGTGEGGNVTRADLGRLALAVKARLRVIEARIEDLKAFDVDELESRISTIESRLEDI
jgi:hypothetical protein